MPSNFEIHVPGKKEVFHSEEILLKSSIDLTDVIIRKTGNNDSYVYNYEVRTHTEEERVTKKRQISGLEYIEMKDHKHPDYRELKKVKQCFMHNNQYCVVETIINADNQPSFLRFETQKDSSEIEIPQFLSVLRGATTDENYS